MAAPSTSHPLRRATVTRRTILPIQGVRRASFPCDIKHEWPPLDGSLPCSRARESRGFPCLTRPGSKQEFLSTRQQQNPDTLERSAISRLRSCRMLGAPPAKPTAYRGNAIYLRLLRASALKRSPPICAQCLQPRLALLRPRPQREPSDRDLAADRELAEAPGCPPVRGSTPLPASHG